MYYNYIHTHIHTYIHTYTLSRNSQAPHMHVHIIASVLHTNMSKSPNSLLKNVTCRNLRLLLPCQTVLEDQLVLVYALYVYVCLFCMYENMPIAPARVLDDQLVCVHACWVDINFFVCLACLCV